MSSFILFIILTTGSSHSKCVSEKSTEHWEKEKKEEKKNERNCVGNKYYPEHHFLGEPKTCFGESFWGTGGISGKLRRSIFFFFFEQLLSFFHKKFPKKIQKFAT